MDSMTLSDSAISHIAQLVQVAILTGTDVVDNLRMAQFVTDGNNQLALAPDYYENFNVNIEAMVSEATNIATSTEQNEAE
jgi:hypothetical protein